MLNTILSIFVGNFFMHVITDYGEGMKNETVPFPHLFSSWTPFDKDASPGCWFLVAWHYFVALTGTSILVSYDPGVLVLIVFFGGKLDLIRERCKDLFGRGEELSEGEVQANLRQLHSMHVELIKYDVFNSISI